MVWDDLVHCPSFFTYSELMWQVQAVAKVLSHHQSLTSSPGAPVSVYGKTCPEVLVAILGVLASPLLNPQECECVAYLPVDPSSKVRQWEELKECGVELVVIETSVLEVSAVDFADVLPKNIA